MNQIVPIPTDPPPAFVCPNCGKKSWHPKDREHRYCSVCGFVDDLFRTLKETNVREATHVKLESGAIERIESKWGIDANNQLAPPSKGGFGCVTVTGKRADMYEARLYFR